MKWINRGRKKNSKSKYIIEQNSFNINHRRHLMTRDGASIEWPNLSLRNILSPTCLISIYPRPSIEFYQILVDKCGSRCLLYSRSTSLLPRSNSQIHLPYRRSVREILAGISIRWMRLQKLAPVFYKFSRGENSHSIWPVYLFFNRAGNTRDPPFAPSEIHLPWARGHSDRDA